MAIVDNIGCTCNSIEVVKALLVAMLIIINVIIRCVILLSGNPLEESRICGPCLFSAAQTLGEIGQGARLRESPYSAPAQLETAVAVVCCQNAFHIILISK